MKTIEEYECRRMNWIEKNCFNEEISTDSKVYRKAGIVKNTNINYDYK